MSKPNSRTNQKMTNDKFWQFRNLAGDDQKAELLLYGDISERSWWEDAATPKRFADDLAALGDVKEITVYINSGGGDVFAAQAIGNMLERNAATVTAHIDGLCASAATIVACHADKVVAAADSSYMVHPVSNLQHQILLPESGYVSHGTGKGEVSWHTSIPTMTLPT